MGELDKVLASPSSFAKAVRSANERRMAPLKDAGKALFLHNMGEGGQYFDRETAEAAWMLDEPLQAFWVGQAYVVLDAVGAL